MADETEVPRVSLYGASVAYEVIGHFLRALDDLGVTATPSEVIAVRDFVIEQVIKTVKE